MNKPYLLSLWSKSLLVALLALAGLGCGLFNSAVSQRQDQNEAISGGTQLGPVTMAEGIGSGNTPLGPTDSFSSSQDVIYAVVEADHIEAGTSMFARWSRDGQPFEDSAEIVADRDYDNTYVEFHLENLRDRMDEGDYSVQIFVNGNPVQEASFTVE
ncbi:MAG: hypothetical protein KJ077_38035 [Anaerolineae bacterium]|nr:hypothetical protein [Anaerolineae bacterium]